MVRKVAKWLSNTVIVLLIIIVILSFYSNIRHRNNSNYIPSILGYKGMSILSGSMSPTLEVGDMIVVKEKNPKSIEVGDVITYRINGGSLVTHRVVEIVEKDGATMFKTQGDANNVEDSYLISTDQIVGVMAFNIPKGGYIANFIRSPKGFILLILLPILILIIGEVRAILSQIKKDEDSKDTCESRDNVET